MSRMQLTPKVIITRIWISQFGKDVAEHNAKLEAFTNEAFGMVSAQTALSVIENELMVATTMNDAGLFEQD